jgi:hypothetical protein
MHIKFVFQITGSSKKKAGTAKNSDRWVRGFDFVLHMKKSACGQKNRR